MPMPDEATPQLAAANTKADDAVSVPVEKKTDYPIREWTKIGITVVAIVVGFNQYIGTSNLTARQPYLSQQLELCLKASEHASRLATTQDQARWTKSREEFWMLHWGPLEIVEEAYERSPVITAMIEFGDALKKIDPQPPRQLPVAELLSPSNHIALACRDLVKSKWQIGVLGWFGR